MEKELEKFLQAEEAAEELLKTLQELNFEIASYKTATSQLKFVEEQLENLVTSLDKSAKESFEIIKTIKNIGGPEILERIAKSEEKSTENFLNQKKEISKLKLLVIINLILSGILLIIVVILFIKHI